MQEIFAYLREFNFASVCFRLVLALIAGGLIGFGRGRKKQTAGLRTYIITCVGAALSALMSFYLYALVKDVFAIESFKFDGSRYYAAVISGMGFLAAGSIMLVAHQQVSGLTTAIGLAIGAGFYEGAVITTVLVLLAETMLGDLVNMIKRDPEFMPEVLFSEKAALDRALRSSKNQRMIITNLKVYSAVYENAPCYRAFLSLRPCTKVDRDKLFGQLRSIDGIIDITEADISGKK